jgi:hypothetical protein
VSNGTGGFGRVVRSVLAVFAGLVVVVVISEGLDFVLRSLGIFPPFDQVAAFTTPMFAAALVYRTLAGVVGGYIAAALAPANPIAHALVLGAIGLGLSTLGAVMMWGVGPAWYPITLAVLALPSAWLGGRFYQRGAGV